MSTESTSLYQNNGTISNIEQKFMSFCAKYGKNYETKAEYQFRLNEFTTNFVEIMEHNSKNGETSTMGLNKFADYTDDEFERQTGLMVNDDLPVEEIEFDLSLPFPKEVNWVTAGAVTPVLD
jgi:hypothetical protein